jgi:hypothetical protein
VSPSSISAPPRSLKAPSDQNSQTVLTFAPCRKTEANKSSESDCSAALFRSHRFHFPDLFSSLPHAQLSQSRPKSADRTSYGCGLSGRCRYLSSTEHNALRKPNRSRHREPLKYGLPTALLNVRQSRWDRFATRKGRESQPTTRWSNTAAIAYGETGASRAEGRRQGPTICCRTGSRSEQARLSRIA